MYGNSPCRHQSKVKNRCDAIRIIKTWSPSATVLRSSSLDFMWIYPVSIKSGLWKVIHVAVARLRPRSIRARVGSTEPQLACAHSGVFGHEWTHREHPWEIGNIMNLVRKSVHVPVVMSRSLPSGCNQYRLDPYICCNKFLFIYIILSQCNWYLDSIIFGE